jgi:hypothetical protein
VTERHYLDPGPKPHDLGPCICADFWTEGDCVHLPDCPQVEWSCHHCRYRNWGPVCTHCYRLRFSAVPEGW